MIFVILRGNPNSGKPLFETPATVRKILERLEDKGAVARVRMDGKAVVYRSRVKPSAMIRKEIGRLLDTFFDGAAAPLVAHLADMQAVTIEDLRELEAQLRENPDDNPAQGTPAKGREPPAGEGS